MTDSAPDHTALHLANVFGLCALACTARAVDLVASVRHPHERPRRFARRATDRHVCRELSARV